MGSIAAAGWGSCRRWVCGEEAGTIRGNESVSTKQPPIRKRGEIFSFLFPPPEVIRDSKNAPSHIYGMISCSDWRFGK